MKTQRLLLAGLIVLMALPVAAQKKGTPDTSMETQLTLAQIQAERKELVEAMVEPTPEQGKPFWDAYFKYRTEVANLDNRSASLIKEYGDSYGALNDDQALRMLKEATAIDTERAAAKKSAAKKMQKILSPRQMVRWIQIENKMDAILAFQLAVEIPLDE